MVTRKMTRAVGGVSEASHQEEQQENPLAFGVRMITHFEGVRTTLEKLIKMCVNFRGKSQSHFCVVIFDQKKTNKKHVSIFCWTCPCISLFEFF